MKPRIQLLAVLMTLAITTRGSAELVVTIGNANLANGQATVDVTLGNNGTVPLSLDQFGFEFQIVPVGNAPAELSFVNPQPQPFADPAYVFYGNSLATPTLGAVMTTGTLNDTYLGGDATADGSNVTIPAGSSSFLLTQLTVSLNGLYLKTPGMFQIVLTPSSLAASGSPSADTFFQYADSQGNEHYLDYTSNAGTITIPTIAGGPGSVPEPSSLAMVAAGTVFGLLARGGRSWLAAARWPRGAMRDPEPLGFE